MRLFVSEYVCGGAWPSDALPDSLAAEGRAMLLAFLEDCAALPGCEVWTTWDEDRCGPFPLANVHCEIATNATCEAKRFHSLAGRCDATCVIAPELGNQLAQRCRAVRALGGRLLNASPDAIDLCSDKLRLAEVLQQAGVATIATALFDPRAPHSFDFPVVVKPRFGAGSESVFYCSEEDAAALADRFHDPSEYSQAIVQPFIPGEACSVAAIFDHAGACRSIFPVAEQRLTTDGRFRYLGGRIAAGGKVPPGVAKMVHSIADVIGGLRGYIGFDFLHTPESPDRPVLVEVNPRLTTSYLGYRSLTSTNLAEMLVREETARFPIEWNVQAVEFSPNGRPKPADGIGGPRQPSTDNRQLTTVN